MSERPGAALGAASSVCAGIGVLLFVASTLQSSGRQGLEGLLELGSALVLGLGAFLSVFVGAICGAMSVSAAAAAGDRRRRVGLPLLVNIVSILAFIAWLLASGPAQR